MRVKRGMIDSFTFLLANGSGRRLVLFMDIINQTVGDSLSDMLMVEAILHARGWDVQDWSKAYQVSLVGYKDTGGRHL